MIESYIERWDLAKDRYRIAILRDDTTLEWCETTSDGCTTGRGATLEDATMPRDVLGLIATFIGEGYELGGHEDYDPAQLLAYLGSEQARRIERDRTASAEKLLAAADAENAQLRRQLDAAEAQPAEVWLCEKDGNEPEPWASLETAQADALASWQDAPYTMRWREEGDTWRLYADDTWTHSVIWRRPIRTGAEPGPLESVVTEAAADLATTPADPEPAPIQSPWLLPEGDD